MAPRTTAGLASFSPKAESVRFTHVVFVGRTPGARQDRLGIDKERKWKGEERAPLPALVLTAPPTLPVLGRGHAGPTRLDGRDGADALCVFPGAQCLPGHSGLLVALSQHLVHR